VIVVVASSLHFLAPPGVLPGGGSDHVTPFAMAAIPRSLRSKGPLVSIEQDVDIATVERTLQPFHGVHMNPSYLRSHWMPGNSSRKAAALFARTVSRLHAGSPEFASRCWPIKETELKVEHTIFLDTPVWRLTFTVTPAQWMMAYSEDDAVKWGVRVLDNGGACAEASYNAAVLNEPDSVSAYCVCR
jgi:hypothetical protein